MSDAGPTGLSGPDGAEELVVPPRLRWLSEVVWRCALVVGALLLLGLVLWKLRVVALPLFVALLLCTALTGPVVWLERRGWRTWMAAAVVFIAFLLAVTGALFLVVPQAVHGITGLGNATNKSVDNIGDWLVDGPLHLERKEVDKYTSDPTHEAVRLLEHSSSSITSGIKLVGEVLIGVVLSLVFTFFFLKDGRRFQELILGRLHGRRELVVRRASARAWATFGGYLRGSAVLGLIEGVLMGGTVALLGGELALTIGVLSFFGAFFPLVGAIVAGGLAVLVTFVTSGTVPGLIVLGVAILTHQLDGNLLGPWIFGRALDLHPVVILVALTIGGSIGGIVGAFVAVPLTGAVLGAAEEFWKSRSLIDQMGPNSGPGLYLPGDYVSGGEGSGDVSAGDASLGHVSGHPSSGHPSASDATGDHTVGPGPADENPGHSDKG